MECRQSRERPESVRQKISKGVKSNGYLQSKEWLKSISEANRNKNRIKKVKERIAIVEAASEKLNNKMKGIK
jgi:hypothetical protein